jgi:hypothetical protein
MRIKQGKFHFFLDFIIPLAFSHEKKKKKIKVKQIDIRPIRPNKYNFPLTSGGSNVTASV